MWPDYPQHHPTPYPPVVSEPCNKKTQLRGKTVKIVNAIYNFHEKL